jgi:predicted aldo/keto reductase-like oxidoreductase
MKGESMLKERPLGRTGVALPLLGFGGIPIMRLGLEDAAGVVGAALRLGIRLIDTARGYGDSETKIGRALRAYQGDVFLASKSPKRDRDGMLEDFEKSAAELGVETVDLYQAHCVNKSEDLDTVLGSAGAYQALSELRSSGRIRFIGITSHNTALLKQAVKTGAFDTVQLLFSFLESDAREEVLPMARDAGLGILAMKPFGGGCIEHYDIALRFVLSEPSVIAIPGMAAVEEVRKNVAVATHLKNLTEDDLARMEEIKTNLGTRYCRRCDYCQPCPNDIPIALALHIPSVRRRVGDAMMKTGSYGDLYEKLKGCDECGLCEERCPFGLPVRDLIKETRDMLAEVLEK